MPVASQRSAASRIASPYALTKIGRRIALGRRIAGWRVTTHLMTHPRFFRILFGVLRRIRPILILRKKVLVTRHEDVKAVLSRDADFMLAEYDEERMLGGSFILNIDWPEQRPSSLRAHSTR